MSPPLTPQGRDEQWFIFHIVVPPLTSSEVRNTPILLL